MRIEDKRITVSDGNDCGKDLGEISDIHKYSNGDIGLTTECGFTVHLTYEEIKRLKIYIK